LIFLVLGFAGYFLAQGLQFFGLYYFPAITVTFILNMTPIFILILSVFFLEEKHTFTQFIGIVIAVFNVVVFFPVQYLFLAMFSVYF